MGRPRMIVLVRHAESEGNVDRRIHQQVPDHKVPLTTKGRLQATEAGERLRALLTPEDSVQFYVSPYKRTRETTKYMLQGLDPATKTRVYEDSRLREQDWGNFQADDKEMAKIRRERTAYGHFFYRIPHGESAADVWDRLSGFCETLFRAFKDPEFPSILVIVTHGLASRIFVCRWFHWSVEKFETLANINHTGFIIMSKDEKTQKYRLKTKMKTWYNIAEAEDSDEVGEVEKTATITAADAVKRFGPISPIKLTLPSQRAIPPHRPHSPLPSPGIDFYYDGGDGDGDESDGNSPSGGESSSRRPSLDASYFAPKSTLKKQAKG